MPYRSQAQSAFIHAKAAEGVGWAKQFVADSHGEKVPKVRHVKAMIGKPKRKGTSRHG